MRVDLEAGRWMVFFYAPERAWPLTDLDVPDAVAAAVESLAKRGRKDGQPFLIGPSGFADPRVNVFFSSRRMRQRKPLPWRKYAYSLALWLNFLAVLGREWDAASEEEAEAFKEWRITDLTNPQPVAPTTFRGDLVALRSFYRWAARTHGVADPVAAVDGYDLMPHGPRVKDIKWLDPGGYQRWKELGLECLGIEGREREGLRARNGQRDTAFADGLYGTGCG